MYTVTYTVANGYYIVFRALVLRFRVFVQAEDGCGPASISYTPRSYDSAFEALRQERHSRSLLYGSVRLPPAGSFDPT